MTKTEKDERTIVIEGLQAEQKHEYKEAMEDGP